MIHIFAKALDKVQAQEAIFLFGGSSFPYKRVFGK